MGMATRWGVALSLFVLACGVPLMWATGSYTPSTLGEGAISRRLEIEIALIFGLALAFALPWVISRWWYTLWVPAWVAPVAYLVVSVGPVVAVLAGAREFGRLFYSDFLQFFHQSAVFGDLVNVTGAWECGLTQTGQANLCDPFGRPYIYPSGLLIVGRLGITSDWLTSLGLLLAVGVAFSLWVLARKSTTAGRIALVVIGVSPTFILLTERANIEAILLPGLLSALWIGGQRLGPAIVSFVVIAAIAFTKFLPAIALIATPLAAPRQQRLRWAISGGLFIVILLLMWQDLDSVEAPSYLTTSFGLPNLLALLSGAASPTFSVTALAWVIVLSAALIGVFTGSSWRLTTTFKVTGRFYPERAIALAALSVVGLAFVGFSSFDYRLILLALVVPLLNRLLTGETRTAVNARLAAACLVLVVIALLSLPVPLITSTVVLILISVMLGWFGADLSQQIFKRNQQSERSVARDKS